MTSTANHLTLPILIRTMQGVWRSSYKLSNSEASRVASIDPLELFLGMQPVTLVIAADNQLSV